MMNGVLDEPLVIVLEEAAWQNKAEQSRYRYQLNLELTRKQRMTSRMSKWTKARGTTLMYTLHCLEAYQDMPSILHSMPKEEASRQLKKFLKPLISCWKVDTLIQGFLVILLLCYIPCSPLLPFYSSTSNKTYEICRCPILVCTSAYILPHPYSP